MPAFALLGLACSLTPRRAAAAAAAERPAEPRRSHGRALRVASWIGVGGAALAAAVSFALPWFSQLEVESAAAIWTKAPRAAYARLDEAANLNPLSDQPYVLAGSIALRYDDLQRAREQFSLALKRTPKDAYATLELGAIVSEQNQPHQALAADRTRPPTEPARRGDQRSAALGAQRLSRRPRSAEPGDPRQSQAARVIARSSATCGNSVARQSGERPIACVARSSLRPYRPCVRAQTARMPTKAAHAEQGRTRRQQ